MAKKTSRQAPNTKSAKKTPTQTASGKKPEPPQIVIAAGAVLWRHDTDDGVPHVAIVHRPRYDDWSLPKGKLDVGENEPVAAVRELEEETGQRSHLGRRLAEVSYPIPEGRKVVHYWAARALGGEFTASREVDELLWLPIEEATPRLTYPHDRSVLERFAEHPADTQTVLMIRHGTAGVKARYNGDDRDRPLDKRGRAQAESLIAQSIAFGATDVYAADRARCVQTVEPLAQELGVSINIEPSLTEEAYAENAEVAHERVLEIAAKGGTPVICSQGKVIPYLLEWWAKRDGMTLMSSSNRKGSTWVLSLSEGRLLAADYIANPLSKPTP